jgi:3-hydroxybutyrate dehydrogenase
MLQGKAAVITGSTSGIGLGIAKSLAAQGCSILVNGLVKDDMAKKAVAEIRAHNVNVATFCGDLSKTDVVEGMINAANKAFGKVDIVVNNAGVQFVSPVEQFPVDKWDLIIALNLSSAFHATRLTLGDMRKRKWGRIINISSAHGLVASPFKSAYVAAKHGIVGFTKTVALECAEDGVTCNAICPGYVWTPLVANQIPGQAKAHNMSEEDVIKKVLLAEQPTRKFVTVEELGGLTAFLCSDQGQSINGAALPVEGGWTAH